MLIEVLVSAVILVMVSLAVFSTLDKTDQAAGLQQKRSIAANYAQSELERIRSLPVEDIAALRGTRTVTRDGIDYSYTVVAKWISDDGDDEPKCTSRSGGLDFMRTTVTVGWEGMGKAKPVTYTSLFTPTAGAGGDTGSVSVRLVNRNGDPVAGVGVTLDGPSTYTEATNKNGCVVFGFVPASLDYKVKFSRLGYVNADSVNTVTDAVTVTAKETTKLEYLYDSGGFTKATFKTRKSSNWNDGLQATYPAAFQMFHAEQNNPGKTVNLSGSQDSWDGSPTGTSTPWFPFTTPYSIYAGNCTKNTPPSTLRWNNGGNNDDALKMVNISPLATQPVGTIQLPAVNVKVYSGRVSAPGGLITQDATVSYNAECGVFWNRKLVNGVVTDPGVPYSANLKICVRVGNLNAYLRTPAIFKSDKDWQEVSFYMTTDASNPNTTFRPGISPDVNNCFLQAA